MAPIEPRIMKAEGPLARPDEFDIEVPTETGQVAILLVRAHEFQDSYTFQISGGLVDQSAEGLTACIQMALLELRAERARWRLAREAMS